MICPNCGGEIRINENCSKCGISYAEMIEGINHDEMKRLLKRIDDLTSHHKSTNIESSLLACELLNSSFLVPVEKLEDNLHIGGARNHRGKCFIMLFTDKAEYDKCNLDVEPKTNPFRMVLDLLEDDCEGFVINVKSAAFELSRKYLETYFEV